AMVVGSALKYPLIGGSQECYDNLGLAIKQFESIVESSDPPASSEKIPDSLRPCTPIQNIQDLSFYQTQIFGAYQGVVQYNMEARGTTVKNLCEAMTNSSASDLLIRLENSIKMVYPGFKCLPSSFEQGVVEPLANTSFSGPNCDMSCSSMRQWIYQSCNEFGFFQTTTSEDSTSNPFFPFAAVNSIAAGVNVCAAAYNISEYKSPRANSAGLAANTKYGARDLISSNITIVNGNMDPWHSLGIINTTAPFFDSGVSKESHFAQHISDSESIVFIDGTAHCRDMYASNLFGPDSEPIQIAHDHIRANVGAYIS
ncbi:hypothetical protein AAMO2058_001680000, partial [Amorphochlora amoebiformis]